MSYAPERRARPLLTTCDTNASRSAGSFADLDKARERGTQMQNTDTRTEAQPVRLSADEAIARMETWTEQPSEGLVDAVVEAALAWADDKRESHGTALTKAVDEWKAERVERVQTSTGSMGCAWNADDIREELRGASMIVEVEGCTMAGCMLRARGCNIAYRDSKGTWRGVGASERDEGANS